jgi:hypothetical protein
MAEDQQEPNSTQGEQAGETVSAEDRPDVEAPAASRAAKEPMDPDAVEPYSGTEPEPGPPDPLKV